MSKEPDTSKEEAPPPIEPDNVLDSIFSEGGPMPTARFSLRALALLLDCVLMTAVASVIIWKVALPQSHPGALGELMQWSQEVVNWFENREAGAPMPEPSKALARALAVANELQLLIFWIYFAVGEAFFAGSSLGKRICRIRSVSTVNLGPPQVLSGIIRGGMKTITLFWLFPLVFLANFLALFFNKRRQLGHDLCARTTVVDEKYVNLQQKR
ncbi:MAG TPA: RDD family protein [Opitutales bacterium]|nr:RDD family protein [Opitutales bacterium]